MLQTADKSNSQLSRNEATPTWPFHLGNFAAAWREVAPYVLSSIIVAARAMFGCIPLHCNRCARHGHALTTKDLAWGIATGKFSASDPYVKESVVLLKRLFDSCAT
jgi:hypothetical protein